MGSRAHWIVAAVCAGAAFAVGARPAAAAPPTPRPETSLLGIHLLAPYVAVLRKFGQPSEIQVGQPTVTSQAQGSAGAPGGLPGMGSPGLGMPGLGLPGMGGRPMGPPGMGAPGLPGFARKGMGMGMPGTMGGPPKFNGAGMAGAQGMGPMGPMGSMGPGGGYPGMPGAPGVGMPGVGYRGSMPGAGFPGYPGGNGPNSQYQTAANETTWWYHYPKLGLHYSFLFNGQGRVIQIQAYGYHPSRSIAAPRTAEGITLGSPLGQVLRRYGWSGDGEHQGDYVVLRYGGKDQIAFQSRHNDVVGIVLGVVNTP